MSKVAVVIRGHLRTWNFVKHHLFHVMESRCTNIDWYFSTWEESVTPERIHNIHQDFQGRFLQFYTTPGCHEYSSWFGPGKLCEQVVDDVMKKSYDFIIETRPDVYMDIPDHQSFPMVQSNSVHFTGVNLIHTWAPEHQNMNHHFGAQDWLFLFSPEVFHRYAHRRLRPEPPQNSHGDIIKMAQKHGINMHNMQSIMLSMLIRPNIFQRTDEASWIWEHGSHWIQASSEEKKYHLKLHDIAFDDYITNNHTISL